MFRSHVAGVFPLHREQILRFFHVQDLISCEILRYSPEEKNRGCEICYSAHIHKYRTLFLDIIVTSEFNCWCFCCNIPFNSGKALTSVSCHSLTQNFSKLNSMESASGSWREKSVPYFKTTQQWTTTLALAAAQTSFSVSDLAICNCFDASSSSSKRFWNSHENTRENIICPLKTCLNESIQTLSSIATFVSPAFLLSWVFSRTANGLRGAIYKRGKRQTTYRQLDFEVGFPLRPFWQRRLWRGCWQTDNPINDTVLVKETGQSLVKFPPTRSRASRIVLPSWTWFFKVCDAPEW